MYNKTTGPYFLKYGSIVSEPYYLNNPEYDTDYIETSKKEVQDMFQYDNEIIIKCVEGIAMLCVAEDLNCDTVHEFVLHRVAKLKANLFINVIPMTERTIFQVFFKHGTNITTYKLQESFSLVHIKQSFNVDEIYSYYYSVKGPGYHFDGESHNYFELTYVDNGSLTINVDDKDIVLNEYELVIFGPGQFHTQRVVDDKPCSYLTVMFNFTIDNYESIINKKFKVQRNILNILNQFVNESNSDIPYREDLMVCYLRLLLINLLQYDYTQITPKPTSPIHQHFENEMLNEILNYIEANLYEPLTIDEICHHFSISRSSLQNLFKDNIKIAPKQYINEAKLKKSRILIQESKHNISEIAIMLGFNSIHYFSRKFTQRYKVTPTDYAKSIYKNDKTQ